jgi:hypothetical protein
VHKYCYSCNMKSTRMPRAKGPRESIQAGTGVPGSLAQFSVEHQNAIKAL